MNEQKFDFHIHEKNNINHSVFSLKGSDSEVEIPRHEYLRFNRGLYAIDIHHQRVRHLDFRFCTDICIVDQEFPDQTVKYTVIVLSKTDMIDVPKVSCSSLT